MSVNTQNGFNDLIFNIEGVEKVYSIKHLENISINIPNVTLDNNSTVNVLVSMRPTNHLYSMKFDHDVHDFAKLDASGELLRRYEHVHGDYQSLLGPVPKISTELRVFCPNKYEQNKLFPLFVSFLEKNFKTICILANSGDERTCLSMLIDLPAEMGYQENDRYLAFFRLSKVSGTHINMLIETAFVVNNLDFRVRKITENRNKSNQKPFIVVVKNILAGRKAFESKKRSSKKAKSPK